MVRNSLRRRVMLKCLRFIVFALLYLWVGKALYLWIGGYHYSGYGGLARFFLAFRDSLFSLPEMLLYVLVYSVQLVSALHHTLVSQLGYDPFAISAGSSRTFGSGTGSSLQYGGVSDQIAYGATFVAFALSLVQFAGLFLTDAMGVKIGWQSLCLPRILNIRAHVAFNVFAIAAAVWLTLSAFEIGMAAGVVAALVAFLLIRWPVFAGFVLWFFMLFGLRPRTLILFLSSLAGQFRRPRAGDDGSDGPPKRDPSGSDPRRGEGPDEEPRSASMPAMANADERLASACSNFSLSVDDFKSVDFERQTLVSRFRELAKKLHPDSRGSEGLMRLLNEDFEYLLNAKGWRR